MLAVRLERNVASAARSRHTRRPRRRSASDAAPDPPHSPAHIPSTPAPPAPAYRAAPRASGSSPAQRISVRTASATSSGTAILAVPRPGRHRQDWHASSSSAISSATCCHLHPDIGHRDNLPKAPLVSGPSAHSRCARPARRRRPQARCPSGRSRPAPSSINCRSSGSRVRPIAPSGPVQLNTAANLLASRSSRLARAGESHAASPPLPQHDANPPRHHLQPPLGDHRSQLLRHLRRDAVAMDVPIRPRMAQEAPLLAIVQRRATARAHAAAAHRPRRASRPSRRAAAASATAPSLAAAAPHPT